MIDYRSLRVGFGKFNCSNYVGNFLRYSNRGIAIKKQFELTILALEFQILNESSDSVSGKQVPDLTIDPGAKSISPDKI